MIFTSDERKVAVDLLITKLEKMDNTEECEGAHGLVSHHIEFFFLINVRTPIVSGGKHAHALTLRRMRLDAHIFKM